jgi:two-component system sensor histidine kinase/response regulator
MFDRPHPRLAAYGVAVLATAVTLLTRWLLWPVLGDAVPHMFFFPAVMIAAYYGGFGPGFLSTVLGSLAANYFFTEPRSSLQWKGVNAAVAPPLFVLVGAIISGLSESLHRARRRVVAAERQRADDALRETEERFRQLAENIHEIFWERDARDDRLIYVSPGYEDLSGRTCEALREQPRSWVETIHPDDRDRAVEHMEQYRRGVFTDGEFRMLRPDGSVRWIRNRAFPITGQTGAVARIAGLAEDITDRKRTEEALRESEQRWRSLTEALPQLVWSATPDGACDYFSTQWTQHTGVPEGDLLGWRWLAVLHPDDREPTRQLWTDSVAGRGPYDVEYRVRRRDGEYRWFKTRGTPIRDSGGRVVKWFGTCTDISELRHTEEALRESEERFRGTFENAAVGITHTDAAGRFLRVNQKYCDIVGFPREELLTKAIRDLTHPDDVAATVAKYAALAAGESSSYSQEKRDIRKDGSVVWIHVSVSLQRDARGAPLHTIGIIQDISVRKRLETELLQAKEAAEAASRAKDEFLANVSHEIRTPMNAILGMTELALDTPLADDQRQHLKTVKSAADNLLGIINDLLDFSKIEAGKLELDQADFGLRAVVGDTLRALAVRAHHKGLELVCQVQPDVPDSLAGDAGRLRQVLLNLVGNALKFTDEGEVIVRVDVAADATSGDEVGMHFTVRDTGIGIASDRQEKIFRAFEQEDTSTTRKYGGTGLGLTIAARLVALMGGQISVDSEPGRGSTFSFTAQFGRRPQVPGLAAEHSPVVLRDLRVLVVDDNTTNRRILEGWLRGWQMEPAAVGDGLAALDALWDAVTLGQPFGLVLLDARMPDTDGLSLAARIRKRAELSATRIVLLTSGDRTGDLGRSRDLKINGHLLKPVQQEELLDTIYRVMSRTNGDAAACRPTSAEHDGRPPSPAAAPLRILVAEDNEFNVRHLQELLARQGHVVGLARNGREALAQLGIDGHGPGPLPITPYDLLLLDLHMPELDGFQVVRAIREHERETDGHVPVIALTARSRKEDRERCLAAGMDDYLAKPLRSADLFAAIERVVSADEIPRLTEPAVGNGPGLLDPIVLLAACGDEAEALRARCQDLRDYLPGRLAEVGDALRTGDAPRLREAAHKLYGVLSVFSTAAAAVASDLEDQAAGGRIDETAPLAGQLEAMAGELLRQVVSLSIETLRHQARQGGNRPEGTAR